eukprot:comp6622_c0_seq1/m.2396 comp6622_c0_seq1/g.2396  ORF comp6622_c0_seq1/g.2396 comp6622_c0_seq1/m.2396 type:complete len:216 (-) comp6622_c0_seq1:173-820(-)
MAGIDMDLNDVDISLEADLKKLQQLVISEKAAPVVLPYEKELIEDLMEQVENQASIVTENCDKDLTTMFLGQIYLMEVSRIQFLLKSYLRTRLWKIEQNALHIAKDSALMDRLSQQEKDYLEKYRKMVESLFNETALEQVARAQSSSGQKSTIQVHAEQPDLNKYVYCRFLEDVHNFVIEDDGEEVIANFEKDSLFILRYEKAETLFREKKVSFF